MKKNIKYLIYLFVSGLSFFTAFFIVTEKEVQGGATSPRPIDQDDERCTPKPSGFGGSTVTMTVYCREGGTKYSHTSSDEWEWKAGQFGGPNWTDGWYRKSDNYRDDNKRTAIEGHCHNWYCHLSESDDSGDAGGPYEEYQEYQD